MLVAFADEKGAEQKRTLAVAPAFSVELEPGEQIIPIANGSERTVKVGVSFEPDRPRRKAVCGWRLPPAGGSSPRRFRSNCAQRGDKKHFEFKVVPGSLKEGHAEIRAVLDRRWKELTAKATPW